MHQTKCEVNMKLRRAAEWYYDITEMNQHSVHSRSDHLGVIQHVFTSSESDKFAYVLQALTGWQIVHASWKSKTLGYGHQALIRSPDDRLLDVSGWVTPENVAERHGVRPASLSIREIESEYALGRIADDIAFANVIEVISSLPYEPFCEKTFRHKIKMLSNHRLF